MFPIHPRGAYIVFGNKEQRISTRKHSRAPEILKPSAHLGVQIDSDLTLTSHIRAITKTARIKGVVSPKKQETLIHASIIFRRVDSYNGLLTRLPKKTTKQLQLIQKAAVRVLAGPREQSIVLQF